MRGFQVSDVEVGTLSLPACSLRESLDERAGATDAGASNVDGLVQSEGNPFISAVHLAFCHHLPLLLSPDDIWLCIAQGFGIHVVSNAEHLRKRFVNHLGQIELGVVRQDFIPGSPNNDWQGAFDEFSDQLATQIGKTRDLIVADFSTTGRVERAASQVVLMSAMQTYFAYAMTMCGIPEIQLLGTPDDWRAVRRRAAVLAEFELGDWIPELLPVLDQFIAASEGSVDVSFWRSFYKFDDRSGGPYVSGWIDVFFPYLQKLEVRGSGKLGISWRKHKTKSYAPTSAEFPSGLTRVPVNFEFGRARTKGAFFAGFVGVSQHRSTLALRPAIGWAVTTSEQPEYEL